MVFLCHSLRELPGDFWHAASIEGNENRAVCESPDWIFFDFADGVESVSHLVLD